MSAERISQRVPLLADEETVRQLSGGYKRPKRQLEALKKMGYVMATIGAQSGRVVLPVAHVEAVARGEFSLPRMTPNKSSGPRVR